MYRVLFLLIVLLARIVSTEDEVADLQFGQVDTEFLWYENYSEAELEELVKAACNLAEMRNGINDIMCSLQYETLPDGTLLEYEFNGRIYARVTNFPISAGGIEVAGYEDVVKLLNDTYTTEYCEKRWRLGKDEKFFWGSQHEMYVVPNFTLPNRVEAESLKIIEFTENGFVAAFDYETEIKNRRRCIVLCLMDDGLRIMEEYDE